MSMIIQLERFLRRNSGSCHEKSATKTVNLFIEEGSARDSSDDL